MRPSIEAARRNAYRIVFIMMMNPFHGHALSAD